MVKMSSNNVLKIELKLLEQELNEYSQREEIIYHKKEFLTKCTESNAYVHSSITLEKDRFPPNIELSIADCNKVVSFDVNPFWYMDDDNFHEHTEAVLTKLNHLIEAITELRNAIDNEVTKADRINQIKDRISKIKEILSIDEEA